MLPSDRLSFITLLILTFKVCVAEQSELICSHQPIVALAGDDVILPCYLDPPISASFETVVWTKPGLDPEYIHFHQDGRLMFETQNPSYFYRTRLFVDELQNGNVSMKIFKVKISDAGKYFCFLRSMLKEASIQLTVGVVSTPIIEVVSNNSGRVVLQCESKGWYPEPEVVWLDGEGNLLSAGPTETVRGPDDLYTVSSRVTVEKRHSNNFTCRVQQKDINQTRETHIYVPDDLFTVQSSSLWIWIIAILIISTFGLLNIIPLIMEHTKRRLRNEIELEGDVTHGVKQSTLKVKGKPKVQKHNVNMNAVQLQLLVEGNQQQEDQREQLDRVQRSQSEETSGAGNNTEDTLKHRETQR
ncbi:butyrophilin subfamily 1 member A1-like isoform X2 [Dicentrarchus labrax]|uniref:butyrophilin subfamily 1 member A1-like isoform X2 n=1 Tax=Dicentrarchus labrax TaxID=13489 RepID=UPI0021F5A4E4|nr:butyrophilin subfamily 1 member A1-like isoform X2 [Dicentrarchus labrax]XP_051255827.1 butyrophilin subfamily 1 member A1-like isoform X2 [Dicentrarchus labrax]XP_051255828.1 butyrophilin subfamily 1 member A1-like isoform X2 [Dicentrarchus labrax]XP_051255829.1 butyrophilin subfamily 1 member A1-like isoform X2 [Dicentrarchus labrax]XP_051255830.1 butyrophilin subfamily 1 member A1-like isoform X2 [Dicentrarchus labrax]XP_051255831.1 butyrophilin subfamily 1 member A1-like isoform X2 [Dic